MPEPGFYLEPGFYWIQTGNERWVPAECTWFGAWFGIFTEEEITPTRVGPRLQPPTS